MGIHSGQLGEGCVRHATTYLKVCKEQKEKAGVAQPLLADKTSSTLEPAADKELVLGIFSERKPTFVIEYHHAVSLHYLSILGRAAFDAKYTQIRIDEAETRISLLIKADSDKPEMSKNISHAELAGFQKRPFGSCLR